MTKEKETFAEITTRIEDERSVDPVVEAVPPAEAAQPAPMPQAPSPAGKKAQKSAQKRAKKEGQYKLRYSIGLKTIAFLMVLLCTYVATMTSIYLVARNNGGFTTLGTKAVQTLVEGSYGDGYFVLLNLILSVAVLLLSLWYLFCAAGYTPRSTQIVLKGWAKIPFDVLTLLVASVCGLLSALGMLVLNPVGMAVWDWQAFWLSITLMGAALAVLLLFFLNVAVRCKAGAIWRNTLVYMLLAWVCRGVARAVRWGAKWVAYFFSQLPFIWKGVAIPLAMFVFNLLVLWLCAEVFGTRVQIYIAITLLQLMVLALGYVYSLLALNHLAEGGKALAKGDLNVQITTDKLCFELKEHAENINRMGGCLTQAVNEQLKSERMKTELITNVSHDIKTPLTSIVNYADLLSKEESDNEKIAEYTEVISRQSRRLKRLIEDLVEASKASTGNLEVNLIPCEVGVLLSQAAGEYQQRLAEQSLVLIAKQPEQPLAIMADGRHLWRVFDNLLGNIYKYAQEGTRVYLSLEEQGGKAMITFKNISKYPLDISAEELMERFVRGDASRHNEGNGLGLSIAQSLTELQGGNLTLHVDGDLFKVVLTFDLVELPEVVS